ncbi:MAG: T9SS type A sorting domain-containing protein [Bacteroidales bacterium]|nr:T9SS type A sorting domain-containing protein [Bacteroidales bacterium]
MSQSSVLLYPNPVQDIAILELNQNESNNVIIQILDSSGRIIEQLDVDSQSEKNIIRIDCKSWKAGIYFIKVNGQKTEVLKLIKTL